MIHIGTSGYSYQDWVGPFYPEGTDKRKFLDHYPRRFSCVEVNYTYYRMPSARTLGAMSAKTGDDFRFAVKTNQEMTHQREGDKTDTFAEFIAALEPLREASKLACVLAQFPSSFKCLRPNVNYLADFAELMGEVPVVVEFRHRSWDREDTYEFLRKRGLGFCCVDQPRFDTLMPPVARGTSAIGYVRFHGRNREKWWQHDEAWERYDYLYSREELGEWVGKVAALAAETEDTYVFFNNHYNAQAVQNATDFAELLGEKEIRSTTANHDTRRKPCAY